jgi:hypothetical protein
MVLVTLRGFHLLDVWWWSPSKHAKKIVRCSREAIVRGIVLTPREPRRATLVERDMKGDKWSGQVKC